MPVPILAPREQTVERVAHPDVLRLGGRHLLLVDDPFTRPIQDGHPTLGWEGDARLALYVDQPNKQWVLVRLERDGVYRITATTDLASVAHAAIDIVGQLVTFLVEHDIRRGYDVVADIDAHNDARERRLDDDFSDFILGEAGPRLKHALRKDGIDP